ncbi:2-oxo acid dehydrogenase subunit E2 [Desulfonema ishimotonii]|uniref:Dihydrolipoamide acetyltransferase component of pyruvate dehydrogenase complex n=1 Tax=Desulfonema ishimotonii TaxID=45657 RepID=A0A401G1B3_9BACT|nr:dihydrolipoamide acetyltransferase family protein [Desulfonema ishimotonii]GBC63004.1 2-oxo acid dehydrogenase subunit E2 [Desulfonema ishimotonii]
MVKSFRLPDLGEGIHEGEVMAVTVSVGDSIREGDTILEVETDKAAVEIPSPFTGTVREILVKAGDLVRVGDEMMRFDVADTDTGLVETTAAEEKGPSAEAPPPLPEQKPRTGKKGPVPASPATRRLARELGADLHEISPTGRGGVVTADDVRAFAEGGKTPTAEKKPKSVPVPAPPADATSKAASPIPPPPRPLTIKVPPLPDFSRWGPVERQPIRSVRRATARHMALSWSQIPHVSSQDVADITALEAFRQKHKAGIAEKGGKLSLTVFALKAAVTALKHYPRFNASPDPEAGELVLKQYWHIGVAVDTDDGLIVPVLRDVDRKSITDLAVELGDLVTRTRARKISPDDLQGGTFTLTNMGTRGGLSFSPIINYPETAIMGMGAARLQPVVRDSRTGKPEIVPRLILPVILAMDHRVLDGADGARFLRTVITALEDPETLMLTMV